MEVVALLNLACSQPLWRCGAPSARQRTWAGCRRSTSQRGLLRRPRTRPGQRVTRRARAFSERREVSRHGRNVTSYRKFARLLLLSTDGPSSACEPNPGRREFLRRLVTVAHELLPASELLRYPAEELAALLATPRPLTEAEERVRGGIESGLLKGSGSLLSFFLKTRHV